MPRTPKAPKQTRVARTGSSKAAAARKEPARKAPARKAPARKAEATTQQTGAQAAVAQLEALGVDTVFGIPGVHNLALFDALRRSSIRTVVVRHEQTCVYAADGYARATGRIGVALTTTGPGAANTTAAMGEAKASRSPVLHISTQSATPILQNRSGRFSLHESPHQRAIMDAVSLWSAAVARAEAIPSMVATGARAAFVGRRGPTFLEVPHDLLDEAVSWRAQPRPVEKRLIPDDRSVERAVQALSKARAPLIWAGGGAVASGAGPEIAKLAEVLDAPVVTTFAGKGLLPPDHPLAVGLPPHQPEVTDLIAASDAVVFVGSDLDGMNTQGWRLPFPRPRISINTIAEDGRRNYASDVVIEADAAATLGALIAMLPAREQVRPTASARVASVRRAAIKRLRARKDSALGWSFVETIAAAAGSAFVLADMAVAGYWTAAYWQAPAPRSFAYPLGWGTLGFALPASVGVAASGRRALVVTGDAGALFGIGELATLAQENLPVCVLVVNDGGYGMLRYDEKERFGDTFAVDLATPDFVGLAKAFGVAGKRCDLDGLAAALRWGMRKDGPTVIEVSAALSPPVSTSPRWPLKGQKEARP